MSKFYKDIGGAKFDTLAKAIYRKDVGQVTDPMDLYLPLLVLPRSLLSWLNSNVKPIEINESKELEIPGTNGSLLLVRKESHDLYSGKITQGGKTIHTFEPTSMPALGGHIMNVCELYDEVAGRKVDEVEKKEIAEATKENEQVKTMIEMLGRLIDKVTDLEAARGSIPAQKEDYQSKNQSTPVVVNVNLSGAPMAVQKEEPIEKDEDLDKVSPSGKDRRRAEMDELARRNIPAGSNPNDPMSRVAGVTRGLDEWRNRREAQDPLAQIAQDKNVSYSSGMKPDGTPNEPIATITSDKSVPRQHIPTSPMGINVRDKNFQAAKQNAINTLSRIHNAPKPMLPKSEDGLDKAKMDEGLNDRKKQEVREQRAESFGDTATNELYSKEGRNQPIAKLTRRDKLKKLKSARLKKAGAFDRSPKAVPTQPQAKIPPVPKVTGNTKVPAMAAPKDAALPSIGTMADKSRAPAQPKQAQPKSPKAPPVPKAQQQMKQALSSVTKDELSTATSDDGERMFKKDADGKWFYNPTGVHAVMTKNSVLVKHNGDDTYSILVKNQEWDIDNLKLLSNMIKLKSLMKARGF